MVTRALIIALAAACAACGDNDPPNNRAFTCTVLYRCGGMDITARVGAVCAGDLDEANDVATELAIDAARLDCPATWQYVRPLCQPQEPIAPCDLSR